MFSGKGMQTDTLEKLKNEKLIHTSTSDSKSYIEHRKKENLTQLIQCLSKIGITTLSKKWKSNILDFTFIDIAHLIRIFNTENDTSIISNIARGLIAKLYNCSPNDVFVDKIGIDMSEEVCRTLQTMMFPVQIGLVFQIKGRHSNNLQCVTIIKEIHKDTIFINKHVLPRGTFRNEKVVESDALNIIRKHMLTNAEYAVSNKRRCLC